MATNIIGKICGVTVVKTGKINGKLRATITKVISAGFDLIAPSAPLWNSNTNLGSTSVDLNWNASTDAVGVTNYQIYKDGALLATVGNVLTYHVTGLTPLVNNIYVVYALDESGNKSAASQTNSITPNDGQAPTAPTSLTASNILNTSLTLTWGAATDNTGVTNYSVFKNGLHLITLGNVLTYSVGSLSPSTTYSFYVVAHDTFLDSPASNTITPTTAASDTTPPNAPVLSSTIDHTIPTITTSWTAPTDNIGVTGYELYRNEDGGAYTLRGTFTTIRTFTDGAISYDILYGYKVRARDAAGNWSAYSNIITRRPLL